MQRIFPKHLTRYLRRFLQVFRIFTVPVVFGLGLFGSECVGAQTPYSLATYQMSGDSILEPLGAKQGQATRGAQIVKTREGQCTLCHAIPEFKGQVGNLAPLLEGVGSRLSAAQIRLRVVNATALNPQSIMPSYYRVDGLKSVDPQWLGLPLMNEQQIEDVVAYLVTLK